MKDRWQPDKASHLTDERQERMAVAWARLRLIDKYETEFARQKRTTSLNYAADDENERDLVDPRSEDPRRLSDLDRDEIESMVNRLPEKQREVVQLLLYDGLTQQEAARKLGVTQPAVWAMYGRARDTLRVLLKDFA